MYYYNPSATSERAYIAGIQAALPHAVRSGTGIVLYSRQLRKGVARLLRDVWFLLICVAMRDNKRVWHQAELALHQGRGHTQQLCDGHYVDRLHGANRSSEPIFTEQSLPPSREIGSHAIA